MKAAPFSQNCSKWRWQLGQVRQLSTMQPTPARSPGLKPFTWAPTAVTFPTISWPGTMGYLEPPHSLRTWWRSEWQMPQ